jgi:hypothetical protein
MLWSADYELRKMMEYFEEDQAEAIGLGIATEESTDDDKGFLRWA